MVKTGRVRLTVERPLPAMGLVALLLSATLPVLDIFLVDVALPVLAAQSRVNAALVVACFALPLAALLVPAGTWGDRVGRKTVLLLGLACFALASLVCAVAAGVTALVIARVFQGVGSGLIIPQVVSGHRQVAAGVAATVGLIISGWLMHWHVDWRLVFLIETPLAILAVLGVWLLVPSAAMASAPRPRIRWR